MIEVVREPSTLKSTPGKLYFLGNYVCDTLEDPDRSGADHILQAEEKIYGLTCIPTGIYRVVLRKWDRYGCKMPFLLDVPHYQGIYIHTGNKPEDTLGCILVGTRNPEAKDFISQSKSMFFEKVLTKIHDYLDDNEKLFLTVRNA